MYSLVIVIVEIRGQRISLVRERDALSPEVSNAFSLDRTVKALNMGIVIGPVKAGMPGLDAFAMQPLLKVPSVLWAIVGLYHGDWKAPSVLCFQDCLCSESWTKLWYQDDMRHPGEQVNDRVVIQSSAACRIHVVNRICFDEFTGFGGMWSVWVVWSDSFLSSVGQVVAPEDTAHATQTDADSLAHRMGTGVWSATQCRDVPPECGLAKANAGCPVGPVLVLQLDVLVEPVPLLFPAPDSTAMDPTAVGNGLHR